MGRCGEYGVADGVAWGRELNPGDRGDTGQGLAFVQIRAAARDGGQGEGRDGPLFVFGTNERSITSRSSCDLLKICLRCACALGKRSSSLQACRDHFILPMPNQTL